MTPRRTVTFLTVLLVGLWSGPPLPAQVMPPGAVHVVTVRQAITPATTSYLRSALERAILADGELLIVQLDTPGGLLEATRDIVQLILNAPIPVAVYISPAGARGASAGTMIILASHVAAMAPATHLGAAHPVSLFGGGQDNKVMGEKIVNDTSAFVEGIAELRGRNVEWAISAVRESKSITARKALELKVIDLIADSVADLANRIDGRVVKLSGTKTVTLATAGKPLINQDMSVSQSFMSLVANPNLLFLLLIIAAVGLYIEFSNPGLFFPGVTGAIALLLALIAMQTLPVSYGALGLLVLGVALLVAEAFIPSFGILGIGGIASLLLGSLFLLDDSTTDLQVSRPMIYASVLSVGVFALIIGRLLVRSFRVGPQSFQANFVGQTATVSADITPERPGRVLVNGELWRARAGESLPKGSTVTVHGVDGLTVTVRRTEMESGPSPAAAAQGPQTGEIA